MIYLDNAATTYPKPECVYKALDIANRNAFNTGRGSYKVAREQSAVVDNVRMKLLKISKMDNADVIFTSSATSALNAILLGIEYKEGDNIYISPFEHNSVIRVLEAVKNKYNINIIQIPFDKKTWNVNEEELKNLFVLNKPKIIILSHVSNVTGLLLPYELLFRLGKKYNSINVLDSSQAFGIVNIEEASNIDFIVFAGHKSLYASFGIAGFIKRKSESLKKYIFGGNGSDTMNPNMPDFGYAAYEAGSPNIVAISGLNASIDWILKENIYEEEKNNTNYLISELSKLDKVKIFIPEKNKEKIIGIVSIGVDGYSSDEVGKILDDEFDISVRTGFHCAPFVHDFIDSMEYNGTVRISLSHFTSKEDIDYLIKALKTL